MKRKIKTFVIPKHKLKDIPKKDIFYIDYCSNNSVYIYSYKDLSNFEVTI